MDTRRAFFPLVLLCLVVVQSLGCSAIGLPATAEPVTLRFVHQEGAADYQALAQEFQTLYPNITVELTSYASIEAWYQSYVTLMKPADAARLFTGMADYYQQQVEGGLLPLDSMLSTDKDFPYEDLFPQTLEVLTLEGKQIGLPAGIDPFVVYANAEKFQAAGQSLPQPAWTMQDFLITASALHNPDPAVRGTDRFSYGFCTHTNTNDPGLFMLLFGGNVVDDRRHPSMATVNRPENVAALNWYSGLFHEHQVALPLGDIDQYSREIAAGNCALWIDLLSRSFYGTYGNYNAVPALLPVEEDPIGLAVLDSYSILAGSEHPQEAWLWIRFLMEHEQASGKLIPPLRSLIARDTYAVSVSPEMLNVARNLPERWIFFGPEQQDERFQKTIMIYYQAADRVVREQTDVQTALDQAQQEAQQQFFP